MKVPASMWPLSLVLIPCGLLMVCLFGCGKVPPEEVKVTALNQGLPEPVHKLVSSTTWETVGHFRNMRSMERLVVEERTSRYDMDVAEIRGQDDKTIGRIEGQIVSFSGVCRSSVTGLDQLVFYYWYGGASDSGTFSFLFYDSKTGVFSEHGEYSVEDPGVEEEDGCQVESHEWLDEDVEACDPGRGICKWEEWIEKQVAANLIYERLRPSEVPTELPSADEEILMQKPLLQKRFSSKEFDGILHEIGNLSDCRIQVTILEENSLWKVMAVCFERLYDSWGIILAQKKKTGHWASFYNIPAGGSKVFLHMPVETRLNGGQLMGYFCWGPGGWGLHEDFIIDLETMTITSAGAK
ncbi:MAG: hypothetical protein JRJ47_00935 [Deltaproteobacteria bacterium]|nr:hypothetical protein [Deltaproteobacteria bacterium]